MATGSAWAQLFVCNSTATIQGDLDAGTGKFRRCDLLIFVLEETLEGRTATLAGWLQLEANGKDAKGLPPVEVYTAVDTPARCTKRISKDENSETQKGVVQLSLQLPQ